MKGFRFLPLILLATVLLVYSSSTVLGQGDRTPQVDICYVDYSLNGGPPIAIENNGLVLFEPGDELSIVQVYCRADATGGALDNAAYEAYPVIGANVNNRAGRFPRRGRSINRGYFLIGPATGSWELEEDWTRIVIALVHYFPAPGDGHEVDARFFIHLDSNDNAQIDIPRIIPAPAFSFTNILDGGTVNLADYYRGNRDRRIEAKEVIVLYFWRPTQEAYNLGYQILKDLNEFSKRDEEEQGRWSDVWRRNRIQAFAVIHGQGVSDVRKRLVSDIKRDGISIPVLQDVNNVAGEESLRIGNSAIAVIGLGIVNPQNVSIKRLKGEDRIRCGLNPFIDQFLLYKDSQQ